MHMGDLEYKDIDGGIPVGYVKGNPCDAIHGHTIFGQTAHTVGIPQKKVPTGILTDNMTEPQRTHRGEWS